MIRPQSSAVTGPSSGFTFRVPYMAAAGPAAQGGGGGGSGGAAVAPAAAAGGGVAYNETLEAYLSELGANNPTTGGALGAMILCLAQSAIVHPPTHSSTCCASLFQHGAAQRYIAISGPPAGAPLNSNDELRVLVASNNASAPNWLLNLLMAAKKKELTPQNTEGFFASLGHTGTTVGPIVKMINAIVGSFPDEVADVTLRNLMVEGPWTTYRLTRVSSGVIINGEMDMLTEMGIVTAGSDVYNAIVASAEAPWDISAAAGIPDTIKAYVCIYLEAAGTPIEKWYQGNTARDNLPAVRVRGAKEIFRRYLELKNDVAGVNTVATVEALTAPGGIAANFF